MTPAPPPLRILHVVESFASGTLSALTHYVDAVPEAEHHVVRRVRVGDHVADGEDDRFASVHEMSASTLGCLAAVRRAVRTTRPDVVHAHSSMGGVFARLSVVSRRRRRVVYTPHCFAFERRDLGRVPRALFRFAEWVLALNTDTVAGCSAGEAAAAEAWVTCRRAVHVPNVVPSVEPAASTRPDPAPLGTVLGAGRISAQKGPDFFAETARELSRVAPAVQTRWLGGGQPDLESDLGGAGVEVTGWLTRSDVLSALVGAHIYLHTAAWEGFPIAVLEAHAADLPIVARRISALAGAPAEWLVDSPPEAAAAVARLAGSADAVAQNRAAWAAYLSNHDAAHQRAALLEVYYDDDRVAGAR